ncbi:MAG: collagen-like protein [Pseudomonas sp.]|uniref:collagen-like protein n=1 Tax=Pseudomonas sp. TaxID=306 RepID=UPI00339410A9
MRKLCLLALLCSPLAWADGQLKVEANALLRLPASQASVTLERLEIADHGTLLLPASLTELRVGELLLGNDARIALAPSDQGFHLQVARGQINAGSHISARGAPGTLEKPPTAGRNLSLRLEQVAVTDLSLDARGGRGAPGYPGLDGAGGEAAGCTWGQASRGYDGQLGGDGSMGAPGARVRLEVPQDFDVERIRVTVDGGAGGPGGRGGLAGPGGEGKGCLLYRAEGARAGRAGEAGQPGAPGLAGSVEVVRVE